jgi:hypothetical protein
LVGGFDAVVVAQDVQVGADEDGARGVQGDVFFCVADEGLDLH